MNPEVDIYLKYVELMRAKRFLQEDYPTNINNRGNLADNIEKEISYAIHLLNNPKLLEGDND